MLNNTKQRYGIPSILFHWLTVLTVIGLFALGLWMVELTYYSEWYRTAPAIHKSTGILLLILTILRVIWNVLNPKPEMPANSALWEHKVAAITHGLLYLLLFGVMCSGYLISTADGRPIEVFTWFSIPALPWAIQNQEDIAGKIHEILAYSLIVLMCIHAVAALKHHFIDKDDILRRMLGLSLRDKSPH